MHFEKKHFSSICPLDRAGERLYNLANLRGRRRIPRTREKAWMKTSTVKIGFSEPGHGVSPAVRITGITLRSREPNGRRPSRGDAMRGVKAHGFDRTRKVTALAVN